METSALTLVRAVKIVVLPTVGKPTMPQFKAMDISFRADFSDRPILFGHPPVFEFLHSLSLKRRYCAMRHGGLSSTLPRTEARVL